MIVWPFCNTLRMVIAPVADLGRQAVLDRVLDERLQQHARDHDVEGVGVDRFLDLQLGAEAHRLDVQVLVDRLELLPQRHEVLLAAQQAAEQPRELHDQHPRRLRLRPDQRRDRGQRVEEEVRVDLAGERLDARRHQEFFLLLQPVLDPRAVPDLDRNRDAQHRREDDQAVAATSFGGAR